MGNDEQNGKAGCELVRQIKGDNVATVRVLPNRTDFPLGGYGPHLWQLLPWLGTLDLALESGTWFPRPGAPSGLGVLCLSVNLQHWVCEQEAF